MPSLKQIRYFMAVAEAGSFTVAATRLFVAQPALSRQIAQLEAELDCALFVRAARGVHLTPAGQLFLERVAEVSGLLDSAAEDARRRARGESGTLRLLHSSSVPVAGPLLAALEALTRDTPGLRVDLDRISSEAQVEEVASGRADLGLARLPVLRRAAGLEVLPLPPERLCLAVPQGHALAASASVRLDELKHAAFVSAVHRERGGLARRVTDLCLARGFVPATAAVVSRKTSMLTLVAAGFGVAVIPACMRDVAPAGVKLIPLADPDATTEAALFLPPEPSPLTLRFAACFRAAWQAAGDG